MSRSPVAIGTLVRSEMRFMGFTFSGGQGSSTNIRFRSSTSRR
jgi:hypothetical protein